MHTTDSRNRPGVPGAGRTLPAALALACLAAAAQAQRSEISYQGQLSQNGAPQAGIFDFEFRLYDQETDGNLTNEPFVGEDVEVVDGLFSLGLGFDKGAFNDGDRYLEIALRPGNETGEFTTLEGRVPFRSVPYSMDADTLDGMHATDFAPANHNHPLAPHVHSDLFAPGNAADPAASVLANGDFELGDSLLFENLARIDVEPDLTHFSWPGVAGVLTAGAGNDLVTLGAGPEASGTDLYVHSQSGGVGQPAGGELLLLSGHGSPVGTGGPGGNIVLNAGWGLGTGPSKGGDIVLIPGAGTPGTEAIVLLDGPTVANHALALEHELLDANGDPGDPGEILASTGTGTDWIEPQPFDTLRAPNGTEVLTVDNAELTTATGDLQVAGDAIVGGGVELANGGRITNPTATRFDFTPGGTQSLRMDLAATAVMTVRPAALEGTFRIETTQTPGAASTDGYDIEMQAGDASGSGSGGEGGDVTLDAGDGFATHDGGTIRLLPGAAQGTGDDGFVLAMGSIGVFRTPSHPIHVGNAASNGNGAHLTAGGMWTNGSDANSKEAFEEVDARDVLGRVLDMPVTTWRYKGEGEDVRHMGPMAQDFRAAFGLGEVDTHIGTVDADGVALAAIKGLHAEMTAQLEAMREENRALRERVAELESQEAAR